jgi:hypothetical protein
MGRLASRSVANPIIKHQKPAPIRGNPRPSPAIRGQTYLFNLSKAINALLTMANQWLHFIAMSPATTSKVAATFENMASDCCLPFPPAFET